MQESTLDNWGFLLRPPEDLGSSYTGVLVTHYKKSRSG